MTLIVTIPNGTTQTLDPFTSDAVDGSYNTYTPHQLGSYTFVFNFPGQIITVKIQARLMALFLLKV